MADLIDSLVLRMFLSILLWQNDLIFVAFLGPKGFHRHLGFFTDRSIAVGNELAFFRNSLQN
jgi:hypothetical protein